MSKVRRFSTIESVGSRPIYQVVARFDAEQTHDKPSDSRSLYSDDYVGVMTVAVKFSANPSQYDRAVKNAERHVMRSMNANVIYQLEVARGIAERYMDYELVSCIEKAIKAAENLEYTE